MDTDMKVRETQVMESFNMQNTRISDLEKEVQILENKLSPILRSEPSNKEPNEEKTHQKVAIATSIDDASNRITKIFDVVNRMNAMCEL